METATITVDKIEDKEGKNGTYTLVYGNGAKFFVGRQDLRSAVSGSTPGDKVTLSYREGKFGPIVTGVGGNGAGAPAPHHAPRANRFANDPKIGGQPIGFVTAWAKDVGLAIFAANATKKGNTMSKALAEGLDEITALIELVNSKSVKPE